MPKCEDCKSWDFEFQGDKPYEVRELPHGLCLRAQMHNCGDGGKNDSTTITLDGSHYMSILMTLPTHCCKEFEKK